MDTQRALYWSTALRHVRTVGVQLSVVSPEKAVQHPAYGAHDAAAALLARVLLPFLGTLGTPLVLGLWLFLLSLLQIEL